MQVVKDVAARKIETDLSYCGKPNYPLFGPVLKKILCPEILH